MIRKMEQWATILDIIETGIEGDKEKCRAYAELLRDNMRKELYPEMQIRWLERVLDGRSKQGAIIHLAEDTQS